MAKNGHITQAEAAEAIGAPLGADARHALHHRREPYFFDYVQEQLIERYGVGVVRARRAAHPHDHQPRPAGSRA